MSDIDHSIPFTRYPTKPLKDIPKDIRLIIKDIVPYDITIHNLKIEDYPFSDLSLSNQIVIPCNEFDYEDSNLSIFTSNNIKKISSFQILGGNSLIVYQKIRF